MGEGLGAALGRSAWPGSSPCCRSRPRVARARAQPAPDLPPLARRLRQEREGRGITQAEAVLHPRRPAGHLRRRGRPGAPRRAPTSSGRWPTSSGSPSRTSPPSAPRRSWSTPPAGRPSASSSAPAARSSASPAATSPRPSACRRARSWPGSSATGCPGSTQLPRLAAALSVDTASLGRAPCPRAAPPSTLGELILARQRELGLRSADLAQLTGTTEATVSRWVNGRSRPALRNLRRLVGRPQGPVRQHHRSRRSGGMNHVEQPVAQHLPQAAACQGIATLTTSHADRPTMDAQAKVDHRSQLPDRHALGGIVVQPWSSSRWCYPCSPSCSAGSSIWVVRITSRTS